MEAKDFVRIKNMRMSQENGSRAYDLKGFSCTWSPNRIPVASCDVVLGRSLGGLNDALWEGADPGTQWSVAIDDSKLGQRTLFQGYLTAVNDQRTSSAGGSGVGLTVTLSAPQIYLSRLAAARFIYNAADLAMQGVQFGKPLGVPSQGDTLIRNDIYTKMQKLGGGAEINFAFKRTARFLVEAAQLIHNMETQKSETEDFLPFFDMTKDYGLRSDYYDLNTLPAQTRTINRSMLEYYLRQWATSDAWSALLATAQEYLLDAVPVQSGLMAIRPLLAWGKTPELTFDTKEVLGVADTSDTTALLYQPDRVYAVSELSGYNNANTGDSLGQFYRNSYPPASVAKQLQGRGVTVVVPSWLAPHMLPEATGKPAAGDSGKRMENQAKGADDKAAVDRDKRAANVAQQYARTVFGRMRSAERSLTLQVPWGRADLTMLGKVAKVPKLTNFIANAQETLYGMVNALTVSVQLAGSAGRVATGVQLTSVRDEQLNNEYGLAEHPVYMETTDET